MAPIANEDDPLFIQVQQIGEMIIGACLNAENALTFRSAHRLKDLLKDSESWAMTALQAFEKHQCTEYIRYFLWLRGIICITLIRRFPNMQSWFYNIKNILDDNHVTVEAYDWKYFNNSFAVYLRASITHEYYYIGMTRKTITKREQNRIIKLLQLYRGKRPQVEPAIRWWKSHGNFWKFVPIVIAAPSKLSRTIIAENHAITKWGPQLNMPHIARLINQGVLQHKKRKFVEPTYTRPSTGHRLWKKARKFAKKKQLQNTIFIFGKPDIKTGKKHNHTRWAKKASKILINLTSRTIDKFNATRKLISWMTPTFQVYALYKHARMMEEPRKGRAIKQLDTVIKKKNAIIPKQPRVLVLPMLAHAEFKRELHQWLRNFVLNHQDQFLPLHLPPARPVEGKFPAIKDLLHNFRKSQTKWSKHPPQGCPCSDFLNKYPYSLHHDGHIMNSADEIPGLPDDIVSILTTSAADTVYMSKENYIKLSTQKVQTWSYYHQGPPITEEWIDFLEKQWPSHLQDMTKRKCHSFDLIKKAQQILQGFILHVEDHAANKTMIFCPIIYHRILQKTFEDTSVFTKHKGSIAEVKYAIIQAIPEFIRKHYSWGFDINKTIAKCYIFLKRKKLWTNARPIITDSGTIFETLWSTLATLLTVIVEDAYPESLHYRDVFGTFRDLKQFIQKHHPYLRQQQYTMKNDDLSGFFTSVPQERIIKALEHTLYRYMETRKHTNYHSFTFTVAERKSSIDGRVIRGRTTMQTQHRIFRLKDILPMVAFALETNAFECMGKVFTQTRGACMGSQIAPALCSMVATFEEYIWKTSYATIHFQSIFMTRYVDNRIIIAPPHVFQQPGMQQFASLDFYIPPICLEQVGSNIVLGFTVEIPQGEISYIVPDQNWQYRSPKSASSQTVILSGLVARLHIIARCSYPQKHVKRDAILLINKYTQLGFTKTIVLKASNKVLNKFKIKILINELE